ANAAWPRYKAWAQTSPVWLTRIRPATWRRSARSISECGWLSPGEGRPGSVWPNRVVRAWPKLASRRSLRRVWRNAWFMTVVRADTEKFGLWNRAWLMLECAACCDGGLA